MKRNIDIHFAIEFFIIIIVHIFIKNALLLVIAFFVAAPFIGALLNTFIKDFDCYFYLVLRHYYCVHCYLFVTCYTSMFRLFCAYYRFVYY